MLHGLVVYYLLESYVLPLLILFNLCTHLEDGIDQRGRWNVTVAYVLVGAVWLDGGGFAA